MVFPKLKRKSNKKFARCAPLLFITPGHGAVSFCSLVLNKYCRVREVVAVRDLLIWIPIQLVKREDVHVIAFVEPTCYLLLQTGLIIDTRWPNY